MIKRIKKIKNLGLLFKNFDWLERAPEFRRINVVYGWNGSGKTTLTRMFDSIRESNGTQVQCTLENDTGQWTSNTSPFPYHIRIFNDDYVKNNIDVVQGKTNRISILLGEQNQETLARIHALQATLTGEGTGTSSRGFNEQLSAVTTDLAKFERKIGEVFTEVAKAIGNDTGPNAAPSRSYRRNDAKRDYDNLDEVVVLSETELKRRIQETRQDVAEQISEVELNIRFETDDTPTQINNWFSNIVDRCMVLALETTSARTIQRLIDNVELADWVESGLKIHRKLDSHVCEYCRNEISASRVDALADHFNEEDHLLKQAIDQTNAAIDRVKEYLTTLHLPDPNSFYGELREETAKLQHSYFHELSTLSRELDSLSSFLQAKRHRTTEKMEFEGDLSFDHTMEILEKIGALIDRHNEKSKNIHIVREKAAQAIKKHHLSSIHEEVEQLRNRIGRLKETSLTLDGDIESTKATIAELRSKISSDHRAADELTEKLKVFLGRDELRFVVDEQVEGDVDETVGYRVIRDELPAERLSTGEQTAIAFVYFLVDLDDGRFDKENGIVVIDDPVSSLDSASMYQAFAFLRSSIRSCMQSIVFTHNFDFLRLLVGWTKNAQGDSSVYMLKNSVTESGRVAVLDAIDPTLEKFESEYQYLFKCITELKSDQDGTVELAYPVPNIARKLWESFLAYHMPNNKSMYRKTEILKAHGYDEQKLDAIYKFTNDQSHMTGSTLNPSLVPEAAKVIETILEMIQTIAPTHYQVLVDTTTP